MVDTRPRAKPPESAASCWAARRASHGDTHGDSAEWEHTKGRRVQHKGKKARPVLAMADALAEDECEFFEVSRQT